MTVVLVTELSCIFYLSSELVSLLLCPPRTLSLSPLFSLLSQPPTCCHGATYTYHYLLTSTNQIIMREKVEHDTIKISIKEHCQFTILSLNYALVCLRLCVSRKNLKYFKDRRLFFYFLQNIFFEGKVSFISRHIFSRLTPSLIPHSHCYWHPVFCTLSVLVVYYNVNV